MPRRQCRRSNQLQLCVLIFASLLLFPSSTSGVSLADFSPRATDLTTACASVYNAQIQGCTNADFTSGSCSSSCIAALVSTNTEVYAACSGNVQDDQMIIAAFLLGRGISSVCPNVVVTTISGGEVTVASTLSESLEATTLTVTPAVSSGTINVAQATAVPSGILVDTSSSPLVKTTTAYSTKVISLPPLSTGYTSSTTTSTIKNTVVIPQETVITLKTLASVLSGTSTSGLPSTSSSTAATFPSSTTTTTLSTTIISSIFVAATPSASGSSSTSAVSLMSSTTSCQHAGDPFQYCSSATPVLQSNILGFFSAVIAAIWMIR